MWKKIEPSAILSWPTPNYVDPVERGEELYVIIGIFLTIATVSVLARLYSRIFIRRCFLLDDGLIVFAYISTWGVTGCVIIGNEKYGWRRHIYDVVPTTLSGSMHTMYFSRLFWGLATSSVRLSICCLYYRLLDRINGPKSFRWVLHIFTGFNILLGLVYIFASIFPCIPIRAYWILDQVPGQKCDNDAAMMQTCAVLNTLSEFVIAIMPIIIVYRLRIDPRQRWTVIGLLSLSFFVAFAGCFRSYFLWKSMSAADYDMSWWANPHFIASEVEIDLSITCACAAPLKPFISYLIRRIKGLPTRLSSVHPRRHSSATTATYPGKNVNTDWESYSGWSTPVAQHFDIEGLPCDGYGYTVTITGPPKRRRSSRLRRRKSLRDSESRDPVLEKPQATHRGIATTKELDIRESFRSARTSEDLHTGNAYSSKTAISEDIRDLEMGGKKDKSWYQD